MHSPGEVAPHTLLTRDRNGFRIGASLARWERIVPSLRTRQVYGAGQWEKPQSPSISKISFNITIVILKVYERADDYQGNPKFVESFMRDPRTMQFGNDYSRPLRKIP